MYANVMKPWIDRVTALCLIIITFPLWIIIGALIYIGMGSPIFFRQKRPGYQGKIFSIYKFRTMNNQKNAEGQLLTDDERITKIGKYLRSSSLDELPQLLNVLKGDMSFVGPRPLLAEYLPLYNEKQATRHMVKPGITGWAQVNGRNAISWEEKFEYDVWYVEHQSLWLDMKIIWFTFLKVLNRTGIHSDTSISMEKFEGNKHHG